MSSKKTYRGRIAPTPSGFLHLGHLQTFQTACQRAKAAGGKIVLRIEDIDFARSKAIYIKSAIADLKKAGIFWDEGDDVGGEFAPYTQSKRRKFYTDAFFKLLKGGFIYPCDLSRSKILETAKIPAKTSDDFSYEPIFATSLRPDSFEIPTDIFKHNWRFKVPENEKIEFEDALAGFQSFETQKDFGDFLIWRKSDEPSYELAVVVDDIAMQITEVVRGKDLLLSTARQLLLYRALNATPPSFAHCNLLKDKNGKKLSKSVLKNNSNSPYLIKNI